MIKEDGTTIDVEAGTSLGTQEPAGAVYSSHVMESGSHIIKSGRIDKESGDIILEEGGELYIGDDLNLPQQPPTQPISQDFKDSSRGNKDSGEGLGSQGSVLDDLQESGGSVPTDWLSTKNWAKSDTYTDTVFGEFSAPTDEITTRNAGTADFYDDFGNKDSFAVVHTGFGSDNSDGSLTTALDITSAGYLQIIFDYNFITAEFAKDDASLQDKFLAKLITSSGTVFNLQSETGEVLENNLTATSNDPDDALPNDTMDSATGGTTGWETFDKTYSIPNEDITLSFDVSENSSEGLGDSAVLLDNVFLNFTAADSTQSQTWVRNDWHETNTNTGWTSSRVNAYTAPSFQIINPPTAGTPKANATFIENFGTNEAGSNNFAIIHTGAGENAREGNLQWEFTVPTGGETRTFSFDYNFITTEFPINQFGYNDYFEAQLLNSSDVEVHNFATESRLASTLSTVSGSFPSETFGNGSASTRQGSQTGWKSISDVALALGAGTYKLKFSVFDAADGNANPALATVGTNAAKYDSAVLIDNVVDPPVASPSTDYLLTFARMLSGEIDIHDADLEADAVASEEHQAFVARVNEVISDMDNISVSAFMESRDEFLDRLWTAREIVTGHEETTEFLQQTAVAHHLLEANLIMNEGMNTTSITAIQDSLSQAKAFLVAHINDFGEVDALANIKTNIDSVLANIDNINNNVYTTATLVAVRNGIKKAFSDTIDHMTGHDHLVCDDPAQPCYKGAL